jgi:caa(3)-type oxidase subunit IV
MLGPRKFTDMTIGTRVILILAALTVAEYIIAVAKPIGQIVLIFLIALTKAVLIVMYFMHIQQLRKGGSHDNG